MNDILLITLRTILGYIVLIVMLKIMGKREIGQLSLFDLLILLSIADIMVIGIENFDASVWYVLVPIISLTIIQKILAFITLKSKSIRTLLDGKESLIINRGKLEYKEMKKQCYNMEDLLSQLRDKDVSNLSEVEYAILENNGKLSIIKYNDNKNNYFPLPLIVSGKIEKKNVSLSGLTEKEFANMIKDITKEEIKNIDCAFLKNGSLEYVFHGTDK